MQNTLLLLHICDTMGKKGGRIMTYSFRTGEFEFEYTESKINDRVLWESHCHAKFEMIAVIEGDINIMLEGRSYRLKENQTVIIPSLSYHTVTANGGGNYRRVTVLFERNAIPAVLRPQFMGNDADIAISFSPQIKELKRICQERNPEFYAPLAQSLMIQIFYSSLQAKQSCAETETDEFLQKAILYIDGHLREKILLCDLAKHTSRSKSSFCHLFEEKMNISPKQYILQKKLFLAKKLIDDGIPPTAAAVQVGYENYSNFYRMYLRQFGTSPAKRSAL